MSVELKLNLRNAWCDCIRGYAILLVCVAHALYLEPLHSRWGGLTNYFKGDTGVFVFYVLSGFLVTGILFREVEQHKEFGFRLRAMGHFFARRIFRLQPSYLFFLTCYAVFASKHNALSWWVLILPLSNWFSGPYITWHIKTLHIEESYYVFIAICCGIFWRSLKPLLWVMLVGAPLGRVLLFAMVKTGSEPARWLQDHYLPVEPFAVGGLLALYLEFVQNFWLMKLIMRKPAISFCLAMLLLLIIGVLRPVKPFSYFLLFTWPMLFSVLSAAMILTGLQKERFVFSAEWLRRLGLVSYTVYLFQQFVLGPYNEIYGNPFSWWAWIAVVAVIILLLPFWYAYIEKPLTDLGAILFPRMSKRLALAEAKSN